MRHSAANTSTRLGLLNGVGGRERVGASVRLRRNTNSDLGAALPYVRCISDQVRSRAHINLLPRWSWIAATIFGIELSLREILNYDKIKKK